MFNIIDTNEGIKADLVPLKREPDYQLAFNRRIQREFVDPEGKSFRAWVAQPSDIIIGKLYAWNEGKSEKHPNDIYSMLVFDLSGSSDVPIDYDLITDATHNSVDSSNPTARVSRKQGCGLPPAPLFSGFFKIFRVR
jgi:hypothetical protein